MFDLIFQPIFSDSFTVGNYLFCTATALALGALLAFTAKTQGHCSKSMALTLLTLPAIVQTVIMLVNGNVGTGIAVMGAFSLVRFRSTPGSAQQILFIFLAMAVGLATAMGYLGIAVLFGVLMCAILLFSGRFFRRETTAWELKITVPESLNYAHAFDDLFAQYTSRATLLRTKTTNMGSLYKLLYQVELKDEEQEQAFLDDLRCRNGNLEIALGVAPDGKEEL